MKKINGFTLIELLAVIIILAVILVIAVPKINNVIEDEKSQSLFLTAKSILRNIDYDNIENNSMNKTPLASLNINNLSNEDYDINNSFVYMVDNILYIDLVGINKYNNMAVCHIAQNDKDYAIYNECELSRINLTVNLNGGIIESDQSGSYISGIMILLKAPTRENYNFAGWEKVSGECSLSGNDLVVGKEDTTIKALWTPIEYNIEYALNEGTASNPTSYNVESNITLTNPKKIGYTFDGWTGSNGSTVETTVTISTGSTGHKSYTANWTPIPYDITYTLNGGDAPNPISYNVESNITLTNPTKPAYTFTGWTGSNGSAKQTTVTISTGSTGNKSYIANWTPTSYDITYSLDGGSATNPTSYNIESNDIRLTNPTKPAYTFTGWTGSNGSTKETSVTISTGSTGHKSYTANWTAIPFTISYNCNGGQGSTVSQVWTHGTTSILSANGCYKITAGSAGMVYYLKGWAKTSTATTALFTDGQDITNSPEITSDTTLYAVWGTLFTITGNYEVINDNNLNWRVKIKGTQGYTYGSASITFNTNTNIDIFLVGGGGGGGVNWNSDASYTGPGGGSGYTKTYKSLIAVSGISNSIYIGKGGARGTSNTDYGKAGETTSITLATTTSTTKYTAPGGGAQGFVNGGSGGSGGGGGDYSGRMGGAGGVDGSDGGWGAGNDGRPIYRPGLGQGSTTRAFGESNGELFAQGGSGGKGRPLAPVVANSGNGGNCGGSGGCTGILIIRNHR